MRGYCFINVSFHALEFTANPAIRRRRCTSSGSRSAAAQVLLEVVDDDQGGCCRTSMMDALVEQITGVMYNFLPHTLYLLGITLYLDKTIKSRVGWHFNASQHIAKPRFLML